MLTVSAGNSGLRLERTADASCALTCESAQQHRGSEKHHRRAHGDDENARILTARPAHRISAMQILDGVKNSRWCLCRIFGMRRDGI